MTQEGNQNLESLKRRVFECCLAIYRLTNLFPENETLKNQFREISIKVIVLLAANKISDTIKKIEELRIYLAVAREQDWAKPVNFVLLDRVYSSISLTLSGLIEKSSLKHEVFVKKKSEVTSLPESRRSLRRKFLLEVMKKRQDLLVEYFNQKKKASMPELIRAFGDVSSRTVRNDLIQLVEKNIIKKIGNTKTSHYMLIE